mmetsp:Transcript_18202/g.22290  ORF Transcript_18202/g.22290 Transcript_18202/m.22290 type:complete len:535 (-) Transcript_18202:532-2136(-)
MKALQRRITKICASISCVMTISICICVSISVGISICSTSLMSGAQAFSTNGNSNSNNYPHPHSRAFLGHPHAGATGTTSAGTGTTIATVSSSISFRRLSFLSANLSAGSAYDINNNMNTNNNMNMNTSRNRSRSTQLQVETSNNAAVAEAQQEEQLEDASTSPPTSTPPPSLVTKSPIQTEYVLPEDAAQTLDGRLICSSQCAYEISSPYFKACAYRPATTAKRVTKGVNSVLIGYTYDGINIAFRGTQSSSPLDWLQNAALFLSDIPENQKITGKIHTGFYRGTKSLWKPIKKILKEMIEVCELNGWSTNVYLTGHSKGGAMATVAAVLMKIDNELPDPTYVCTFASAKVGDSQFRDEYNQNINQTSYEAHLDLIPFLPPSASTMETMNDDMKDMIESMLWSESSISKKEKFKWDYQTVGQRKFITESGLIIENVTKELDDARIQQIESSSSLSLDEFKASHCISCSAEACNGYYFAAIANNLCNEEECDVPSEDYLDSSTLSYNCDPIPTTATATAAATTKNGEVNGKQHLS